MAQLGQTGVYTDPEGVEHAALVVAIHDDGTISLVSFTDANFDLVHYARTDTTTEAVEREGVLPAGTFRLVG